MTENKLLWVGLICCLVGLGVQLFPEAAFHAGIDFAASWRVFGFGVFLILIGAAISAIGSERTRR
ncbi:MAG: hypothetical protein HKN14_01740 [Marinicaulis sp.]|nr:hypothetical protein [Marinicaulis sp.]